jgi:two-component system, LytTR family, sensor kinase
VKHQKLIVFLGLVLSFFVDYSQQLENKSSSRNSSSYEYLKQESKYVDVNANLAKANKVLSKDPQNALQLTQEALISAKFNADTLGQARCYAMLGKINTQSNQYALAEKNYQKSSVLYQDLKMSSEYHQTKLLVAKSQLKLGSFALAKLNSDTLILKSKDISILADAYEIIGEIHYLKKEYALAITNFKKQEELEQELMMRKESSSYKLGKAQANLAKVYAAQKDNKNADLKLIESSKSVQKKFQIKDKSESLDDNLLESESDKEEYYETQEEVFSNYKGNKEIQLRNATVAPAKDDFKAKQELNLSEAYYNSGQYDKAIQALGAFEKSIDGKKSLGNSLLNVKALKLLSQSLSKSGNNEEALIKYQEYVEAQEKAFEEQKIALELSNTLITQQNAIETIEKEFDLYTSDLALSKEEEKNALAKLRTQQIINYGLLFLLLIVGIAGFFIAKNAKEKRKANQLLALKSLRSQMNPHFIFNALNSVNSFIAQNDERSANKFLTDFSKLMRMVLDSSHEDLITLEQELAIIELYLKLEQYRFRDKFDYQLNVSDDIEKEQFMIPPMLIQPFIENAVWHGLRYKESFGKLKVSISRENESIQVTIQDDGIGRERSFELKTKNQQQNSSKGLHNTTQRIKVINDLHNTKIELQVKDLSPLNIDRGTDVLLKIPKVI